MGIRLRGALRRKFLEEREKGKTPKEILLEEPFARARQLTEEVILKGQKETKKTRTALERAEERFARIGERVSQFREERDKLIGEFRKKRDMTTRRLLLKEREKENKRQFKMWADGEDNVFMGKYADKWPKRGKHRRPNPKKKKKPWYERKGLWD